jgi:hypothetical protein
MKYKNKQSIGLTLLASLFLSHAATAAVAAASAADCAVASSFLYLPMPFILPPSL